jgi:hypothetical protein
MVTTPNTSLGKKLTAVESYLLKAAIAGFSCASVAAALNPLDVTRIRLQLQHSESLQVPTAQPMTASSPNKRPIQPYRGMLHGVAKIYREEGLIGWSKGLTPSMMRELFYSTIRMGAYEPIKHSLFTESNQNSPAAKLLCGLLAGGFGAAIANPLDLIKTRFTIEHLLILHHAIDCCNYRFQSILPHEKSPYPSTFQAFRLIYLREHGLHGLYKGWQVVC